MNLLVSRLPDYIIRTDACKEGLGGFLLTTGRAWRYKIPNDAQNSKSINYLEFLACITGIMVSEGNRSALPPFVGSHGYVPKRPTRLHHNAVGALVQQRFLALHQKTSQRVQQQCFQENDSNPKYHHLPDPNQEDPRSHNPMAATANMGMGASGATINRNVFLVWS